MEPALYHRNFIRKMIAIPDQIGSHNNKHLACCHVCALVANFMPKEMPTGGREARWAGLGNVACAD